MIPGWRSHSPAPLASRCPDFHRVWDLARHLSPQPNRASRFVQKNGGRADCLALAVLSFGALRVPVWASLGLGVGFGGKAGERSKPDFNPYSQGDCGNMTNCQLLP